MVRRSFFAELQRQARQAERERQLAQREAERAHKAAMREAERARREHERAIAQQARAQAAEQKRLAKEAREARIAAMNAEAEALNLALNETYEEIDSLLAATLEVDDYVDLNTLRVTAEHPPFDRPELEIPTPPPAPIDDPPKPELVPPLPLRGLAKLFGKKRHARDVADAAEAHELALGEYRATLATNETAREKTRRKHREQEALRLAMLDKERERYAAECAEREKKVSEHNEAVDKLIADLGYGAVDAVQEYVAIVMANSVYPDQFKVTPEFTFDAGNAELRLRVLVPDPAGVPSVGRYKYVRSSDEIVSTELSQKARKDRYASAVQQVALRSIHEVFEADRRGIIRTISLEVGTNAVSPATGQSGYFCFVAVGAERDSFLSLNLSNVVPTSTLAHLGAAVSKNPFGLVSVASSGVRRS